MSKYSYYKNSNGRAESSNLHDIPDDQGAKRSMYAGQSKNKAQRRSKSGERCDLYIKYVLLTETSTRIRAKEVCT